MLSYISSVLWYITTIIITITALYNLFDYKKLSKKENKYEKNSIKESIKLLNLTLAGKIGVGSITGIVLAILIGGKGTLFWIWISSFFLSLITYKETKLGIKYGGPQLYIDKNLKKKKLSRIYSVLIICTYLFSFILIQSKTIISSVYTLTNINITILLIILVFISIRKGIDRISKITSYIVPIMSLIYILIGTYIIIKNHSIIPSIFKDILLDSIKFKSLINIPIIIGFERAIFSTESGMGTTSMVVSLSKNTNYKQEALIQIIGVFFITLIICTISALIILTTKYESLNIIHNDEIALINYAFNYHFGYLGPIILTTIILFFSFSTIITSFYYGDLNIKHLFNNKNNAITKIIVIIVIVFSNFLKPATIWILLDIVTALITIINIYSIFKLKE